MNQQELDSRSDDEILLSGLMIESQKGDSQAYDKLLHKLQGLVLKYVRSQFSKTKLQQDKEYEDIAQEVLLAIHRNRANYDPNQRFLPWFYTIARHKVIDHFRKYKNLQKLQGVDDLDIYTQEATAHTQDLSVEAANDLEKLAVHLQPKQWEILKMTKLQEYSVKEVSEKLGYSESDVKVTAHRAIKHLNSIVRGKDHADQ